MNVASLELCRELYELSEWIETFNYWEYTDGIPEGVPYLSQPELERRYGLWSTQELKKRFPAYDCGYLLRKLPDINLLRDVKRSEWMATAPFRSKVLNEWADTPEDTLCKLAIALFKEGVLVK